MRRPWPLAAALLFVIGLIVPSAPPTAAAEAWAGGVELYRDGTFTTQHTWTWCTAAGVQIVRNIATGDDDHTRSGQQGYFDWMRDHNRYDLPPEAGVDPAGWTAGLREFVDDRYRLVAGRDFDTTLREAVTNLRLTELPVALAVARGNHGWILTGFTAEVDPAATDDPGIETVTIVGPLYGRQSRNGYDMPPGTRLTVAELRRFFTPWRYEPLPMAWDGRYVSIQPIAAAPAPTPVPTATPSPSPSPTTSPSPTPSPTARPSPTAVAIIAPTGTTVPATTASEASDRPPGWPLIAVVVFLAALVVTLGVATARSSRRSVRRPPR